MNAAELYEEPSIIDQIINDFEPAQDSSNEKPLSPRIKTKPPVSSAREPVKIQGIDHNSFAQWLRSKEQVRKAIQQHLETPKLTLKNCIALFTEYNIKVDDNVVLHFPIDDIYPYREYDREMKDGWTGKMNSEEYTELMKDVNKHGIKEPGLMHVRGKGAEYEVQLGEGNHRLRVAEKLGIETMPITFSYSYY